MSDTDILIGIASDHGSYNDMLDIQDPLDGSACF